jgi:hypothetical protein
LPPKCPSSSSPPPPPIIHFISSKNGRTLILRRDGRTIWWQPQLEFFFHSPIFPDQPSC